MRQPWRTVSWRHSAREPDPDTHSHEFNLTNLHGRSADRTRRPSDSLESAAARSACSESTG
jgi:hypothetical protein